MINVYKLTMTSDTGGAGAAAASTTLQENVNGFVEWVYIDYGASEAATADVVLTCEQGNVSIPIITVTDNATDVFKLVRSNAVSIANAVITNSNERIAVVGNLKATLAQGNDSKVTNIYVAISDR